MLRLRGVTSCVRRLLHGPTVIKDQVMDQLRVCSAEHQVLDVIGKHKAKLTVDHVGCAARLLWHFQKQKHNPLKSLGFARTHPQFLTLQVLAENKIAQMDDQMLVDTLYFFLRLGVEHHNSLIQQLISEVWLRLDSLQLSLLSKFSVCLGDVFLHQSPLMGHITNILAQNLSSINDSRTLTTLMISTSSLMSPQLRDAILSKAEELLDTTSSSDFKDAHRVLQFLSITMCSQRSLLEKCNHIVLRHIPKMEGDDLAMILSLFLSMHFHNTDFIQAVKQRLVEVMDSSIDPSSFTKLFEVMAPVAGPGLRQQLENTALLLADKFDAAQALTVVVTMEASQSRNLSLMNKIASVIRRNLDAYRATDVARITQAFCLLKYQNHELFTTLSNRLLHHMQRCISPQDVTTLTSALSMLPGSSLEEVVKSRLEAVMTQCNLLNLNMISLAIAKWVQSNPSFRHSISGKYAGLLQTLTHCGRERLQTAERLDLLLEELKSISGEWFEEMLLQETIDTLLRMSDQINGACVSDLAAFLTRIGCLCPPLMDRIASVVMNDFDKIHIESMYTCLLPFSVLNYDPPQAEKLYDISIKHITPYMGSFRPHIIVLLGFSLAVVDQFPEEIIREIFSVDFLRKLDTALEIVPPTLKTRTRFGLMKLNRAVCLDCPEFQVPWFHDSFFKHHQKRGIGFGSPVQKQIHKMLVEILGGINFVQQSVFTPYYYTIDFECVLDKDMQPLPYSNPNTLHISEEGNDHWGASSPQNIKQELPPGAQRVALDYLDGKFFPRNSHLMFGEALMKKRHLEILGYRYVQITHFEWNSMELSSPDAWKEYLKRKIFREES